jgi:4Fe-4S single cluster domain of Ferredoxin I
LRINTRKNVSGKFYCDDQCIDCDLCRETAPANFANGYAPKKVLFAPRVEKTGLGSAG